MLAAIVAVQQAWRPGLIVVKSEHLHRLLAAESTCSDADGRSAVTALRPIQPPTALRLVQPAWEPCPAPVVATPSLDIAAPTPAAATTADRQAGVSERSTVVAAGFTPRVVPYGARWYERAGLEAPGAPRPFRGGHPLRYPARRSCTGVPICRHFNYGVCLKGAACAYDHGTCHHCGASGHPAKNCPQAILDQWRRETGADGGLAGEKSWQNETGMAQEEETTADGSLASDEAWQSEIGFAQEEETAVDGGLAGDKPWYSEPRMTEEEEAC